MPFIRLDYEALSRRMKQVIVQIYLFVKYKLSFFSRPRHRVNVENSDLDILENAVYCLLNDCQLNGDKVALDATASKLGSILKNNVKKGIEYINNYLSRYLEDEDNVTSEPIEVFSNGEGTKIFVDLTV